MSTRTAGIRPPTYPPSEAVLAEEFGQACVRMLSEDYWPHFERLNVTRDALERVGYVGVELVETAGHCYWPSPYGNPAVVVACWLSEPPGPHCCVENPIIADLVAFYPARPAVWWYRTGQGRALGWSRLAHAEATGEPVRLYRTPLDYLRAGGDGAVLLDHLEPTLAETEAAA
jgi:hypothetical protein